MWELRESRVDSASCEMIRGEAEMILMWSKMKSDELERFPVIFLMPWAKWLFFGHDFREDGILWAWMNKEGFLIFPCYNYEKVLGSTHGVDSLSRWSSAQPDRLSG
ncbi:hypothetical protein TIFTF001_026221 [Ficus carica]|uniref:Uncharacterized protein n=1 Tax=Ficus carica TaxID=3494 RepID=A0AA88DKV6_FICCA|nr:hypothetical protein TIFTF001_026221 [Ficus carica]